MGGIVDRVEQINGAGKTASARIEGLDERVTTLEKWREYEDGRDRRLVAILKIIAGLLALLSTLAGVLLALAISGKL